MNKSDNQKVLDLLFECGMLAGYDLEKVYEEPGVEMRTSQKLTLVFPNKHTLIIDTICSGSSENVDMILTIGSDLLGHNFNG